MAIVYNINHKSHEKRYAPRRHEEHEEKMINKRQCYLFAYVEIINIIELWIVQSKQLLKIFRLKFNYKLEIPDSHYAFNSSCPS